MLTTLMMLLLACKFMNGLKMKKAVFYLSCAVFNVWTLCNVYALDSEIPKGQFNPPKNSEFVQLGKVAAEDKTQKTIQIQKIYSEHLQQVAADVSNVIGKCKISYDNKTIKTYAELVGCYNPAIMDIYEKAGYPHMDLMQSLNDKRFELGKNIDNALMTETQAELALNAFYAKIKEEEKKRNTALANQVPVLSSNYQIFVYRISYKLFFVALPHCFLMSILV